MQQPNNIAKFITILGAILVLVIFMLVKCDGDGDQKITTEIPTIDPNVELKKQVADLTKERDRLKALILKKDTARPAQIKRYGDHKTRIGDITTAPCDTIREYLPLIISDCDSIIAADSFIIGALKDVVATDSAIISKKDEIIANDSTTIDALNHKAMRFKRQRNVAAGVGAIGWLLALFK